MELRFPRPLYVVAAPLSESAMDEQPAVINGPPSGTFDEELLPAIVGIWYALHLPKSRFETLDLPLVGVQDAVAAPPTSHAIAIIPDALLDHPEMVEEFARRYDPALIICADETVEVATARSKEFGFSLPPVTFSALGQTMLDDHWHKLSELWKPGWPEGAILDPSTPRWIWPIGNDGSVMSLNRLSRLMGHPLESVPLDRDPVESAIELWEKHAWLEALRLLEDRETPYGRAESLMQAALEEVTPGLQRRLSLSLSGTSTRYVKFAEGSDEVAEWRDDYPEVRAVLVAHSAIGDDSFGVTLENAIPPAAFHALAELERHWGEGPRPDKVRRLLKRLNESVSELWKSQFAELLRRTTSIDAFTNFPIGLLTLPGDSAPMAARIPISYRSINPLTRALQFELSPHLPVDLSGGFTVMVAECIPASDRVGQISRQGWATVQEQLGSSRSPIKMVLAETLSPESVRDAIAEHQPQVLVLSAHGFHSPESNSAGVVIGETPSLGSDLGDMPPVVILSACHTAPRGGGVVSVADLLIRAGAEAVLGTLVPVDVRHNSQFMSRFFLYLSLAIEGSQPEETMLDVWRRVQSNNVIIDIGYGNSQLAEWCFRRVDGVSPLEAFMVGGSARKIRPSHLYEDAEAVLAEIADAQGMGDRVRNWMRSPGYLPESIMYVLIGNGRSIRLK